MNEEAKVQGLSWSQTWVSWFNARFLPFSQLRMQVSKAIYPWVKRHGRDTCRSRCKTPGSSTSSLSGTGMWRYDSQRLSCLQRDMRVGGEMTAGRQLVEWCPHITVAVDRTSGGLLNTRNLHLSLVSQNSLSWPSTFGVFWHISVAIFPGVLSPQTICF